MSSVLDREQAKNGKTHSTSEEVHGTDPEPREIQGGRGSNHHGERKGWRGNASQEDRLAAMRVDHRMQSGESLFSRNLLDALLPKLVRDQSKDKDADGRAKRRR